MFMVVSLYTIKHALQVATLEKLLYHLPKTGCNKCVWASPPKHPGVDPLDTCEDLFLKAKAVVKWRKTDKEWFERQRRGINWHKELLSRLSYKAGLSRRYTNGSYRPSTITEFSHADYSNGEISQFTGQRSGHIIEGYKKRAKQLSSEQRREASMLMSPSGREVLRGSANKWGQVVKSDVRAGKIGRTHALVVQGQLGLDALQQKVLYCLAV